MALANAWSSHDFLCHHLSLDEPFGLDGEALESFGISDSFGSAMAPSASSDAALGGFEGASGGGGWFHSASSFLNFERGNYYNLGPDQEDCDAWIDAMDQNYQMNHLDMKPSTAESNWLIEDQSYAELVSAFGSSGSPVKGKRCQNGAEVEILQGTIVQVKGQQKRPCIDGNMPSPKKRCGANRTLKEKQSPSKDLQSIAAKNRRERISERLKILQDLVPNGTKVDLVTMLEKAINYVKFLQLQVKVLATDEFWPAQGEKAPDLAQVKEAIDAILSSHKDRQL